MKKIFVTLTIILILSINGNAEEKKDCENKALINKFFCKNFGSKKTNDGKDFSLKPDLKNFKEKKTLADLFKKKN